MKLLFVLFALVVAVWSPAAAQGCSGSGGGPGCDQKCDWEGFCFRCSGGFQGCYCIQDGCSCSILNCDKEQTEEDEDEEAAARLPRSLHLLDVAGYVYLAVDACASRAPAVFRLESGPTIEIVRALPRAGSD